jgi:hypothetical protein
MRGVGHSQEKSYAKPGNFVWRANRRYSLAFERLFRPGLAVSKTYLRRFPVGLSTWSSVSASLDPRSRELINRCLGRAARLIVRRLQRLFLVWHRDNEALALGVVRLPVYSPKLVRFVSIHPDMGFAPASVAEA